MTDIDGELQKLLSGWKAGLVLLTCAFPEEHAINSALRKLEKEGFIYLEPLGPKNKNVCLTDSRILWRRPYR